MPYSTKRSISFPESDKGNDDSGNEIAKRSDTCKLGDWKWPCILQSLRQIPHSWLSDSNHNKALQGEIDVDHFRLDIKNIWSEYRIQGHFSPPHLHVSGSFIERDEPYRQKTPARTVLFCLSSTHETEFQHYSNQRGRTSARGKAKQWFKTKIVAWNDHSKWSLLVLLSWYLPLSSRRGQSAEYNKWSSCPPSWKVPG